jgi:asparagine synthase (glutamine-hydrolysing)
MLNALSVALRDANPEGCVRASRSLARQGFVPRGSFEWNAGVLSTWAHPTQLAVEDTSIRSADGFACCVGPLWYRGRFGTHALRILLGEFTTRCAPEETELRGNFALFLCKDNHCILTNDVLGFVRIYVSADGAFYSTSWLATCEYMGQVELDEAAATEYVLLGASHSEATVAQGVTTLPLAHRLDLAQRSVQARIPASSWVEPRIPASFDAAVEELNALLRTRFAEAAQAFRARVRIAISGGFDSRLILAELLATGVHPGLFVYGNNASEDVRIARAVAAAVDIPLEVVDKSTLDARLPQPSVERLVDAALFFDGLPNDGIDDRGTDQKTRLQQVAGGYLGLNGGGGEIFRNYFHLPNRRLHAIDIVRSFYRGFDSRVFRRTGGLRAYESRMAASIERTLGLDGLLTRHRFAREQVELLYPLFRCHHWMAVNNSVAVRHGYYATPLVDLNTVRLACRLPLVWKNAGRLESSLIAGLHRRMAELPSVYGFRFSDGPDWRARLAEWRICARPIWVRPRASAVHRLLRGSVTPRDMLARYRTLLPGEWRLDPVLDLRRLPGRYAVSRALAIEIAWRKLVA